MDISAAGDQSLLVSFAEEVNAGDHGRVVSLFRSLRKNPFRGVLNLHPAYASLLIQFDALRVSHQEMESLVRHRLSSLSPEAAFETKTVTIPVCYCREFGPDLQSLAEIHGLSEQDVVDLHAAPLYTVYFLGFVPGFAYMGLTPERIATPRLPTPRKQVPGGSVGIADRQTGVYPMATPGGWRLIGRTPIAMTDLLEPGDRVRFRAISEEEFHASLPA